MARAAVAIVLLAFLPFAPLGPFEERTVFAHFAQEYASVGELKAARLVAERGLEHYPDDGPLLHLMGELALADGDRESALGNFRRAAHSINPQAEYFFSLARLLTAEERLDEAPQTVGAALKMWPENVEGLVITAELQRQKGDIEGATKTLLEAQQLAPTAPEVIRAFEELRQMTVK